MHLGDSTQWRSIAEANEIEDPLALRPGSLLAIPEASG
jgi:nucleoid-associated protein YgaU